MNLLFLCEVGSFSCGAGEEPESLCTDGQICSSTGFVPVQGKKLANISRSGPLKVVLLSRAPSNCSIKRIEEEWDALLKGWMRLLSSVEMFRIRVFFRVGNYLDCILKGLIHSFFFQ